MTEPTDDEIAALRSEFGITSKGRGIKEFTQVRDFARAVLAKWGTPPAVAGEPYGYLFTAQEATIVGDERKSMREVFTRKKPPCASVALYTTPQPTQAQAGAVPLTPEAINAMAREYPAEDLCGWSYRMGVADTEAHHGIKGGQHGAE